MRPAEFPEEAIIQAGQELQAAGRNITGFALRQKVGGGNPARLKQVWEQHHAEQANKTKVPRNELSAETMEALADLGKDIEKRIAQVMLDQSDRMTQTVEAKVQEQSLRLKEILHQSELELSDAAQAIETLESALSDAQKAMEAHGRDLMEARRVQQEQSLEVAQLKERAAQLERIAKAAEKHHATQLMELRAELQHSLEEKAQQALDHATFKSAAESEMARMNKDRELRDKNVARLEEELDVLRQRLASTQNENAALVSKLSIEHERSLALENTCREFKTEALEYKKQNQILSKEKEKAREELAHLHGQMKIHRQQNTELMKALRMGSKNV